MYQNNFNLLRLFAALAIVYNHMVVHLKIDNDMILFVKSIISVFPGVPIFFLISGYLITMSYEKNQNIWIYSKNRFLRIVPGLYFNFFISLIILWYFGEFLDVSFVKALLWSIAQLTLFQFYNPEFIKDFGVGTINGSLWTISVELFFYILLPFIYVFLKKDFFKRIFLLIMISYLFFYYKEYISSDDLIYEKLVKVSILPYLYYFLFGFYTYKNIGKLKKYIEDKFHIYLAVYLLVVYFNIDSFIYIILKQLLFSILVFSFAFSYRTLSYKILKHHDFTYGIYIYHMLIINVFVQLNYIKDIKIFFFIFFLSIILGIFSYIYIEKPFLNMKRKSLYNDINKEN